MSAVPEDVIIADEPTSTLQPKEDDSNHLMVSSELSTHGDTIDDTTSGAEGVAVGSRHVPEACVNDDSGLTTVSDDTIAAETSVDVLHMSKVAGDGEPQLPVHHTDHTDNENIVIIQPSELSANDEIESHSAEASEQLSTFAVSTNVQPVIFAEPTRRDANEVADAAISEIRKDESLSTDDREAQTPPLDADTTVVNGSSASVKDGESLIGISIGPEGGVSGALEPSINGVGSTTDAEPCLSLETLIHDPNAQMNRSAELLEEVTVPAFEASEIPPEAVEPVVVEDTIESQPNQGEIDRMEAEVSHADEHTVVTEPIVSAAPSADIASEDTPMPIEAESAYVEPHSSSSEPETNEAPVEEIVAITEPESEPILQPTEAIESELMEERVTTVEVSIELDSDTASEAGTTISAAEPVAEFTTPVAVEETIIEEVIEALDQPTVSTEPEACAPAPEVVSAPIEAAMESVVVTAQSEEDTITEIKEPEISIGTEVAEEEERLAASDSSIIEPTQVAVSDSEPTTPTETGPDVVAETDAATVVPETPAVVEPEPVELELEESVETVPIDVEPPSSNTSFIEDPEVGLVVSGEEPQTSVYEETVISVSDSPALESSEESKPQEVIVSEEPSVDEISVAEDVPADFVARTREPISAEETAPAEEPVLGEEVITAPTGEPEVVVGAALVDNIAPVEDTTFTEDATFIESADSVEEAIEASEFIIDTLATHTEEMEVPVVQEALTAVEVANDEQPPHHVEEANDEILVPVSTAEEQPSPVVMVATSVEEEDIPIAENSSAPASTEEDTPAFELSTPAPVEGDILAAEELSVPTSIEMDIPAVEEPPMAAPAEDIIPVGESPLMPAPIEDTTPAIEELPTPTPVEDVVPIIEDPHAPPPVEDVILVLEDPPASAPVVQVNAVIEETPVPPVKEVAPVTEELPISAPVEEVFPAEEAPSLTLVEGISVEEHTYVVVEETSLPEEQPEVMKNIPTSVAECDATELIPEAPVIEDPPMPEEVPAVDILSTPVELTYAPEHTPVPEAISITAADSMLTASLECSPSVAGQSVFVEEAAFTGSEVSTTETVATEELHSTATVEFTEETLITGVETNEESSFVEVPALLTQQPVDEAITEESPEVPIKELATETLVELPILEEGLTGVSQVHVTEEPTDAAVIHFETNESLENSESPNTMTVTSSEIQEVSGQQETAATTALSVITEIERPKSPWTPSYSVTTQGPGVPVEEPASSDEGEDDIISIHTRTPEIIVDEAAVIVPEVAANVAVDTQSQGDTDVVVQPADEQVALDEAEEVRPKSPWTPSYSVTVQGNVGESNEVLDDGSEQQLLTNAAQHVETEVEELPISVTQEPFGTGEVSISTEAIVDVHTALLETQNDTMELVIPDPVMETEVPQCDSVEQLTATVKAAASSPESAILEDESEDEIELGSFIVEDEKSRLDSAEPAEEHNRSLWTSSYSVTGLESATSLEDEAVVSEDEFVEHGSFIIENPPAATVEVSLEAKPELLTPVDDPVGERPKSPWTPSYSVTKQGPNEETEELDELEQLPGPAARIPELATDEVPIPPVLITETRASVDGCVTAEAAQEIPQAFPILEGSQKLSKKLSLSAVDELNVTNNVIDITGSTSLRIDIPTTNDDSRKRLESTTSSRFFPGGWFSSSPKVPEEGRTSLDVATGEFVSQISAENTPTTAIPSAVEEDRERKSRWCTIM